MNNLILLVKPHIVPFTFGDEPLMSGSHITIHCTVDEGDLPLSISWIFHGQELSSQMGIETAKLGKRTNFLTIESIAQMHMGQYTCLASNPAGSTNHTASLTIRGYLRNQKCLCLASCKVCCLILRRLNFSPVLSPSFHF